MTPETIQEQIQEEQQKENTNTQRWLNNAVDLLRPIFSKVKLEIPVVHVSCGFPSTGGLAKRRVRGECWKSICTKDGSRHIFISPIESDPLEILGVLSHESLHAALSDDAKHGKKFKAGMQLIGLTGDPKSAMPDPHLNMMLERMLPELGEYPHTPIIPKEKKERTSAKKTFTLFCPKMRNCDKSCLLLNEVKEPEYKIKAGVKSLKLGLPSCPCNCELELEPEDYEIYKSLPEAG